MPIHIRKIPYPNRGGTEPDGSGPRVESGATQFGNDWPGLFLRGQDCIQFAEALRIVLQGARPMPLQELKLEELAVFLESPILNRSHAAAEAACDHGSD